MGVGEMSDGEQYPYGTSISLDNELCEALELDDLKVGDEVMIMGKAFVDSKSEYSDKNSSNKSVRLQLTSLSTGTEKEKSDPVKELYGDE